MRIFIRGQILLAIDIWTKSNFLRDRRENILWMKTCIICTLIAVFFFTYQRLFPILLTHVWLRLLWRYVAKLRNGFERRKSISLKFAFSTKILVLLSSTFHQWRRINRECNSSLNNCIEESEPPASSFLDNILEFY